MFDRVQGMWDGKPADVANRDVGVSLAREHGVPIYGVIGQAAYKFFPSGYFRQAQVTVIQGLEAQIAQLSARCDELELLASP